MRKLINWFIRRHNYFIVVKLKTVKEAGNLPESVLSYVKRYFWIRRFKVNYFEPYTKNNVYLVFGTPEVKSNNAINQRAYIFLLELHASLQKEDMSYITPYLHDSKTIGGYEILIYKILR